MAQQIETIVDVEMGEHALLLPGTTGRIEGLGPCMGIILYQPTRHVAYAGHFMSKGELKGFKQAAAQFLKEEPTLVYATGGSPMLDQQVAREILTDRAKAMVEISSWDFVKRVFTAWAPPRTITDLFFETKTGKALVRQYRIENDEEQVTFEGAFPIRPTKKKKKDAPDRILT